MRGRGTPLNPKNRFERFELLRERVEDADEEVGPETVLLKDSSRTIIATNESPDVGFDASVNPYRGCENGCLYCLSGDTPVLMANGTVRPIADLRVGDEIYGTRRLGWLRTYRRTRVLAHWQTRKPAYRVTLEDGTTLVASGDHRFLTERGWKHVMPPERGRSGSYLTTDSTLMGTGAFASPPVEDEDYKTGYLCGVRGGAHPVVHPEESWCKGFLAGVFDAAGSFSGGLLRIMNTDPRILGRTVECLDRIGINSVAEGEHLPNGVTCVRVRGGLKAHVRFFNSVAPAITRKFDIEGAAVKGSASLRVRSIEPLGREVALYDITTGTGDFIANGVVSHNCYARPNHEYLGFSAGLDFETKILVKEDAPELLRRELSSPRWKPQTIAFSGVTDAYQPVERKLRITRRCLEVMAEFRNPVGIITKSALVTRDKDILAEMARYDAAMVMISLTSLDRDLIAKLEPRAARPEQRLAAVRELAEAGIPVGVNVQPIIPGLTDHEIPAILEAAAKAGARFAGKGIVRLPLGVADIFEAWLEEHFPDRKEKVLNRLRDMRGGRLNDPNFVTRMRGKGAFAEQIYKLFEISKRRAGIPAGFPSLSTEHFRRPSAHGQMGLFE